MDTTIMMLEFRLMWLLRHVFGMTITKVAGVFLHIILGNVLLEYSVPLAIGTTLGGQLGPRLSKRAKPKTLRRMLSIIILLIGIRMIMFCFPS